MRWIVLVAVVAAAPAYADIPADQMTIPKGHGVVDGFLDVNLSSGAAFQPISLSPDVWYGATDDLTVGLVHSSAEATGILALGVPDSLCLTGGGNGCATIYPTVGADVRVRVKAPVTVDGGIYAVNTDPFHLAIKLGVDGRIHFDKITLEYEPNLFIALNDRDAAKLNRDVLHLPGMVTYAVDPRIEVGGQLALLLPFEDPGSLFQVTLALAVRFHPNPKVGVGAIIGLPALIGGQSYTSGVDKRTFELGGSYAF